MARSMDAIAQRFGTGPILPRPGGGGVYPYQNPPRSRPCQLCGHDEAFQHDGLGNCSQACRVCRGTPDA